MIFVFALAAKGTREWEKITFWKSKMCIEFGSSRVGIKRNVLLSLTVLDIGDELKDFGVFYF